MYNQSSSNQNNMDFTKQEKVIEEKEAYYDENGTEYLPDRPLFTLKNQRVTENLKITLKAKLH